MGLLDERELRNKGPDKSSIRFTPEETLSYLMASGMIDLDGVNEDMNKLRKEHLLQKYHPYSITESKDGSFRTWIKDETRPNKRRQIVRTKKENLIDYLVEYYSILHGHSDDNKITMRSLFSEWLDFKALHVEKTTIERIRRD